MCSAAAFSQVVVVDLLSMISSFVNVAGMKLPKFSISILGVSEKSNV